MERIQHNATPQPINFLAGELAQVTAHLQPNSTEKLLALQVQEFGYTGARWNAQSEVALLTSEAGQPLAFGLLGLIEQPLAWSDHFLDRKTLGSVVVGQIAQLSHDQFEATENLTEPLHRVRQLMVLPEHRGQGYLRVLLQEIHRYLARHHDQKMLAIFARAGMFPSAVGSSSSISSHELVPMYARLGFSVVNNKRGEICCPQLSNRYYNVAMVQPISSS